MPYSSSSSIRIFLSVCCNAVMAEWTMVWRYDLFMREWTVILLHFYLKRLDSGVVDTGRLDGGVLDSAVVDTRMRD